MVTREVSWWVLEKKGIFIRYINMTKDMYNGSVTEMRTAGGNTSEFLTMISFAPRIRPSPYLLVLVISNYGAYSELDSLVHAIYG